MAEQAYFELRYCVHDDACTISNLTLRFNDMIDGLAAVQSLPILICRSPQNSHCTPNVSERHAGRWACPYIKSCVNSPGDATGSPWRETEHCLSKHEGKTRLVKLQRKLKLVQLIKAVLVIIYMTIETHSLQCTMQLNSPPRISDV